MARMHVVLVTRQFWPRVGGAEVVLANLAHALDNRGIQVTVLTARWNADWPDEFVHGGVRVLRLPQPPVRFWGTWRYMRALTRWLRAHHGTYDLVYVSMLKHDAYAVLGAVDARQTPVILRPELGGPLGDVRWQDTATFGRMIRRRTRQATALVAIASWIRDELIAAGYPAHAIDEIANGVAIPPARDAAQQQAARKEFAESHLHLHLPPGAPLAIYTGRLHASKGLADLIAAWPKVLEQRPDARLWLVGEGPERDALAHAIRGRGLQDRIVLAGQFDTVGEFHLAADAYVHPSHHELMSIALLEAMAAGLPVVATDIVGNRNLIEHERHGLLAPASDPQALASGVLTLLGEPQRASRLGSAARRHVHERYSLDAMADAHETLFRRLVSRARRNA